MEGVKKMQVEDKEILIIDYSGCKETEMINRLMYAKELIQQENKPALVLCIFNDKCYATPTFMRQSETVHDEVRHLIIRNAIIGLTDIQRTILKGFNVLGGRNLKEFTSFDESVDFLTKG